MTTVKELSEKLGVSKTSILKYAKEEMGLKTTARVALQLSANQCSEIANHFSASQQAKQPEAEKQTEKHLQTSFQLSADRFSELQTENAVLKERISGLEKENALLRERLEAADKALEREQAQARGFWSRLGRKLLGSGD